MSDPILHRYLQEISAFTGRNLRLGWVETEFIQFFAEHGSLSTYDIWKLHNIVRKPITSKYMPQRIKKSYKKPMIHKNVRIRVQRLYKSNLIARDEAKKSEHNAKYYKLTSGGIYNIVASSLSIHGLILKSLLRNYPDNIIFKTLLYLYFEVDTLLKISDFDTDSACLVVDQGALISKISSYLNQCCNETELVLSSTKKMPANYYYFDVENSFVWQCALDEDKSRLIGFLKRKFNLTWADKAEYTKSENSDTIRMSYRSNFLSIKLNDSKDRAILKIKGKEIYELAVLRITDDIFVVGPVDLEREKQTHEQAITQFNDRIKSLASNVILDMTLNLEDIPESHRKFLSGDIKFMQLLDQFIEKINENYHKLADTQKIR